MKEPRASMAASLRHQEETRARAEETKARALEGQERQRRALEIAEEAMHDRQEMLALLRRIAEILETRPRI